MKRTAAKRILVKTTPWHKANKVQCRCALLEVNAYKMFSPTPLAVWKQAILQIVVTIELVLFSPALCSSFNMLSARAVD